MENVNIEEELKKLIQRTRYIPHHELSEKERDENKK